MSSRQLEEINEELAHKQLASDLNITYDELTILIDLGLDEDTEESNDGHKYNRIITLSKESPKKIINKITISCQIQKTSDSYLVFLPLADESYQIRLNDHN